MGMLRREHAIEEARHRRQATGLPPFGSDSLRSMSGQRISIACWACAEAVCMPQAPVTRALRDHQGLAHRKPKNAPPLNLCVDDRLSYLCCAYDSPPLAGIRRHRRCGAVSS
jgi:hypothetical protein